MTDSTSWTVVEMSDRAQFTTPRWMPVVAVSIGVLLVVADAVLEAQREAMTECAPDCQLGAPPSLIESVIANPLPFVGAGAAVATLGMLIIALDRAGIVPTWLGGGRDERQ